MIPYRAGNINRYISHISGGATKGGNQPLSPCFDPKTLPLTGVCAWSHSIRRFVRVVKNQPGLYIPDERKNNVIITAGVNFCGTIKSDSLVHSIGGLKRKTPTADVQGTRPANKLEGTIRPSLQQWGCIATATHGTFLWRWDSWIRDLA